jgi:hypothetical protein
MRNSNANTFKFMRTPYLHGKPKKIKTTVRILSQYKVITTLNTIGSLSKGSLPKRKQGITARLERRRKKNVTMRNPSQSNREFPPVLHQNIHTLFVECRCLMLTTSSSLRH